MIGWCSHGKTVENILPITYNNIMDIYEQTDAFVMALDNLITRYTREFELTTYTLAGALEEKKLELLTNKDIYFEPDQELTDDT